MATSTPANASTSGTDAHAVPTMSVADGKAVSQLTPMTAHAVPTPASWRLSSHDQRHARVMHAATTSRIGHVHHWPISAVAVIASGTATTPTQPLSRRAAHA